MMKERQMWMNNQYQQPQNNFQYNPGYNAYPYNPWANMQRMPQQEQFQSISQPVQSGINGKIVSDINAIAANDVPMDGSVAIFPKNDLSEIYAKQWASDGKISTVVFKPVQSESPSNLSADEQKAKFGLSDDVTEVFMQKFDELFEKIEQIEKSIGKNSASKTRAVKKDGES